RFALLALRSLHNVLRFLSYLLFLLFSFGCRGSSLILVFVRLLFGHVENDLADADVLDKSFRIKVLLQLVVGDLNRFACLVLIDEDIAGAALFGRDSEFGLVGFKVCAEVRFVDLNLVAKLLGIDLDPANGIFVVGVPVIVLDRFGINLNGGSDKAAQMLLRDGGAKVIFETYGGHTGLLEAHAILFGAGPRVEHLPEARLDLAVGCLEAQTIRFVKNEFLANKAFEHLRAVQVVDGLYILASASPLPLSHLLSKGGESVLELSRSHDVAADLCNDRVAATGASKQSCAAA